MMEVRHADLIGKIEIHTTILEKISERNFSLVDLWQLSSYKDAKGETRKEYQVTKKGCEFLAHKTTGEKGDLFTQTLKWTEQGREMWFLAKDVANWIEHSSITMMLKKIDEDEKVKVRPKQSLGLLTNNNEYWFLTEDGLYEVLMQSRKPIAKAFKKEVKQNIKRFKEGVDFIDLKDVGESHNNLGLLQSLGYSKMQVSKAEHIYLLSERGYAKLIKNNGY